MGRRRWMWFGVGLVVFAGFGVWAWFLAGKTLEIANQWSSVLSSFAALAGLVMSVVALLRTGGADGSGGGRNVQIGGSAKDAIIVTGDHSPVDRRRDG